MAASAKIQLKKLRGFIEQMVEVLEPLKPVKAHLKYTGAFDIDKDGKWSLGGKADAADVITLAGGVPVSVQGGIEQAHDTQGSADLELEIEFG